MTLTNPQGGDVPKYGPISVLAAAFAAQWITGFGFITLSLLAPLLAAETGLNDRDFGLGLTFFFIGTALSSPLSGTLVRMVGSAATLAAAMAFMATVYLVCLAGSWWAMMVASFAFGLGYGPQGPVGMTMVTQATPIARRGFFLALRQSAQPFAAAVAGRVLPPFMLMAGWQAGVISTAVLLAMGAVAVFMARPLFQIQREPHELRPAGRIGLADIARTAMEYLHVPSQLRLLWGVGILFAISQMAIIIFSYLYLLEVVGLSAIAAGIFVSNQQIAGLTGRPLFGWICDVTGQPMHVLAAICVVTIASIIALLHISSATPYWQLTLLAMLTGIAGQAWNAVFTTAMSFRVAPNRLAEMNGRAFSVLSLGWMAAPSLFWVLIELTGGYLLPFVLIALGNAIAVVALLFFGSAYDRL
ncbi:MAG: MFS transporter [Hyphomicrobiaceae bacterium]